MARIGLSGLDLYPLPTLSDTSSAKTLFELATGYTSQESFTDISPPSSISNQAAHYQATYRKMKRLSSVWLIEAVGSPDAAFVDIDLEDVGHEVEEEALALRKQDAVRGKFLLVQNIREAQLITALTERYENKVHMLTTALHSLLLDDIEAVDEVTRMHIFGQLVEHLLDMQIDELPKDDNELLGQLRSAAAVKTFLSTDANNLPDLQVLLALQSVPVTPLSERRGQQDLSLGGLLKHAVHDELLGWTLHNHRVREDPDFPQVPIWDERADSEREHLHLLSLLREENSIDFFTHATFVKETRISLLQESYPSWNDVQVFQEDSLPQCEYAFDVEIMKAKEGEPFRLLAARIEYLLPTFRRLPKEDKVLPYINLDVLQAADFLELDDFSCRTILRREMRLLIKQHLDVASIQYECIFDLNIQYPTGKLAESWDRPSKINHTRRARIASWANEIETMPDPLSAEETGAALNLDSALSPTHASVNKRILDFTYFGKALPPRNASTPSSDVKHNARLRNSLRSIFALPHPALLPCSHGMRPVPDWDAARVRKPAFARQTKAMGLLDVFNVQKDEEERGKEGEVEGEVEVDYAPCMRRGLVAEGGWEMGVLGSGGGGLAVDEGVFGFVGVMVPGERVGAEPVTPEHLIYGDPEY